MTNTEVDPPEIVCTSTTTQRRPHRPAKAVEIIGPREVPLGGPRAMLVRRTLPLKARSLIGGWCFCDHYGPQDVAVSGGMNVAPHPHTGLQTVSWLFQGEIEHRDSVGTLGMVRPGELNLMTAGRGIAHSEVSTPATTVLHGVQLWLVLPEAQRAIPPAFEHVVPQMVSDGPVSVRVFIGSWLDQQSPATVYSPLVGAEIRLQPGTTVEFPLEPDFEHGVLVDTGALTLADTAISPGHLGYIEPGATAMRLRAGADAPVHAVLLGGAPLGEDLIMWWNFIGRDHDEIVEFRRQWMAEFADPQSAFAADARFGPVVGYDGKPLPAPEMPTVRLRPRQPPRR